MWSRPMSLRDDPTPMAPSEVEALNSYSHHARAMNVGVHVSCFGCTLPNLVRFQNFARSGILPGLLKPDMGQYWLWSYNQYYRSHSSVAKITEYLFALLLDPPILVQTMFLSIPVHNNDTVAVSSISTRTILCTSIGRYWYILTF